MEYTATMEKTQSFLHKGNGYKETDIDRKKSEADFRMIDVDFIVWRDGTRQRVTKRELKKLQSKHTWMTDF